MAVERSPALLLVDFMREISGEAQGPRIPRHKRTETASPELGAVEPVNKEWVRN